MGGLLLAAVGIHLAQGAEIEVSPGDDLVTLTETLSAGDVITLRPGVHQISSRLDWTAVGTASAPIRIQGAGGGAAIIELVPGEDGTYAGAIIGLADSQFVEFKGITIRGDAGWAADPDDAFYGLSITDSADILLDGVTVSQTYGHGVYLHGDTSRVTVQDSTFHAIGRGSALWAGCSDASCVTAELVFDHNLLYDIGVDDEWALVLHHGSSGALVQDNVFYNIREHGIYLGNTNYGDPLVVEGNALWNLTGRGMLLHGAARVRNNLIFNAERGGISSWDPEVEGGNFEDIVVSYNTVVNTGQWALYLEDWWWAPGMVLSSNALCNATGYGMYREEPPADTAAWSDNYVTRNVACGAVEGFSSLEGEVVAGNGYADYVDVLGWNLYPTADSALTNDGDPRSDAWVPEVDFNGIAREGDTPDVGAYEWVADDNPGWAIQEGFKVRNAQVPISEETVGGCCQKEAKAEEALVVLPLLAFFGWRRRELERE